MCNKQKPSPVVKPQHCSLHRATPTGFQGARMLPPLPSQQLMVRKDEVVYISLSASHTESLPSKTLLL